MDDTLVHNGCARSVASVAQWVGSPIRKCGALAAPVGIRRALGNRRPHPVWQTEARPGLPASRVADRACRDGMIATDLRSVG